MLKSEHFVRLLNAALLAVEDEPLKTRKAVTEAMRAERVKINEGTE